jgi:membrane protein DedA with SNARE-associated domain
VTLDIAPAPVVVADGPAGCNLAAAAGPLLSLVDRFGYLGIALVVFIESFGVPAPGETAIIAGATYAGRGHLNVMLVAMVAFLAAVTGDSLGYLIGRTGGRPLVLRYGRYVRLTPQRLDHVETFMTRHGPKVVVVARFVEGLRQFNGIIAGATGMPWARFLLFNAVGAAAWVAVWTTGGYLAGNHLSEITATIHRYQLWAIAAAVLGLVAYLLLRRARRRRDEATSPGED